MKGFTVVWLIEGGEDRFRDLVQAATERSESCEMNFK